MVLDSGRFPRLVTRLRDSAAVCALLAAMLAAGAPATFAQQKIPAPRMTERAKAISRESAPANMIERARQLADTAIAQRGPERLSGLRAALDTLIDIVEQHPASDIAVQLRNGRHVGGLSIVDLSVLIDGLADDAPLSDRQASIIADMRERAARDDPPEQIAEADDSMVTGSVKFAPMEEGYTDYEVPSGPNAEVAPAISAEEAIAACDRLAASPNDAGRTADGIWQTVMDADAAALVCTQAVKAAPTEGRLRFQLGRALYRQNKYESAALQFGQAAANGHVPAQAQLGLMLIAGEGTDRDAAKGFALVEAAAARQDPFSIAMLGELTMRGIATARDESEAKTLFHKAAALGSPIGMQRLGETLSAQNGGAEVDADALDWLNKAVSAGAPTAHYTIGTFHRDGRVVEKNPSTALSHFRLAAMAGDARALYEVGASYLNGRGVQADQREGVSWMRRAAEAGMTDSYYSLAYAHAFGRGADRNPQQAARYMFLSLKANSETARAQMTRNHTQWPPDMREALQQMMTDSGVYKSSVDGNFGPATIRAIAELAHQ
ncbi:tetratricopeptide repeat protein [Tepidamorphus sp. 3E244]|uniref:tetratricopeptide repeat protein n=1 Tax=Tepidamorphus sp. 3E244 TaxID=3385498 RepID=UPI0038FCC4D5